MRSGSSYARKAAFMLAVVLLGSMLFPVNTVGEHAATRVAAVRLDAVPRADWQKTAAFPDWKGYTDDTLAMNSMISFQAYHGQGTICLSVPGDVES